ncbi:MAG TPA: ferredoxin [Nitrolancea sp.]|nr:ferredoxin [Nitrolancea sp.]
MLKVRIDPKRCVAYGRCASIASGAFQVDEETRKAFIDEEELEEVTTQQIFAAARACPTQAISIEQFGRRLYPQVIPPMRGVEKAEQHMPVDSDEHS